MIYLGIINLIGIILMFYDKFASVHKKYRIPEIFLILVALIGGTYGIQIGMYLFHHKTLKPKFKFGIPFITFIFTITLILNIL